MRHTPTAIRQFLYDQLESGLSVASFCADNDLKAPTFYSWKRKYGEVELVEPEGFCKITPRHNIEERVLRLPSGLEVRLSGLSVTEIAELILEIERGSVDQSRSAHA